MSYYECIGHSQAELDASYSNGYSAGVTAADNRANSDSTNYKTGYNSGYSNGTTAYKPASASLGNDGAMYAYNSSGTQVYSQSFSNNYNNGWNDGYSNGISSIGKMQHGTNINLDHNTNSAVIITSVITQYKNNFLLYVNGTATDIGTGIYENDRSNGFGVGVFLKEYSFKSGDIVSIYTSNSTYGCYLCI